MLRHTVKPRPDQHRTAKDLIESSIESCKHLLLKEDDLEFHLAWEGRAEIIEELGGVQGRALSSELITLSFNAEQDGWKDSVRRTVAHDYAHTYFYEQNGLSDFLWQWVLEEALSQQFAEHVFPEIDSPQRHAVGREKIEELWPSAKKVMSEEMDYEHEMFYGGETFPRWYGHSLAYMIGEKLLKEHEFEDFPDLTRSDVVDTGDELFG
jgi:uncharacterized protein YjaZ